ncbi:hypothetical protein DYB37_012215 [Aphanomyces astaci]|uniref:Peptidase S1 domain-containing protein n=1 Tax=Aphanomyces astaci TaxID=112090 RepID=A0A418EH91_APHAT|nr:hypothetical protein DYB37_012215 [Aphanomyces astaci]
MVKFLALAAVAACAVAQITEGPPQVINGIEVPIGKYSYVTSLRLDETYPSNCIASLVAPKILLTAAHCLLTDWAKFAYIGSHYLDGTKDGELIKIVKHTKHPKYNKASRWDYDFAVLELETASSFPPIKLNWDEDQFSAPGVVAWVRGFGTTKSGESQSPVLLEADVPIYSNDACRKTFTGYTINVTASMICAGGESKDTCNGNSGGPLTVTRNGIEYLAGVTSWGLTCGIYGFPGGYARISEARDFIEPFLPKTAC